MAIEGFFPYAKEDAEKYTRLRWWLGITWADLFNKHTDIYPEKIGLVDDRGRWSNSQLREEVDRLAIGFMKLGIKQRDRVLLQLPNWHEFIISFLALHTVR